MTCNIQSECFILVWSSYSSLEFLYEIGTRYFFSKSCQLLNLRICWKWGETCFTGLAPERDNGNVKIEEKIESKSSEILRTTSNQFRPDSIRSFNPFLSSVSAFLSFSVSVNFFSYYFSLSLYISSSLFLSLNLSFSLSLSIYKYLHLLHLHLFLSLHLSLFLSLIRSLFIFIFVSLTNILLEILLAR